MDLPDLPTNPETEQETPAASQEVETSSDTSDEFDGDEQPEEGQATEPETEEVEFNGNKYRIPKDIAPHLMMQADYTRKTQEVAEIRKSVEAQRAEIQREAEINQAMIDDIAQARAVETRLQALQRVNWNEVPLEDQQRLLIEQMQLRQAKEDLGQRMNGRRTEIEAMRERETATALSQAVEVLTKPKPEIGWTGKFDQTTRDNLTKFGLELGYSNERLNSIRDAIDIQTLNLARIGYEALKKQRTATAKPAPVEAKPVPEVTAAKSPQPIRGLDDRLSTDEWMRRRNEQLRKKSAR